MSSSTAHASPLSELAAGGRLDDLRARCVFGEVSKRLFPEVSVPVTTIGRYELEGFIGAGARGGVYLARDPQVGRRVAIKLLRDASTSSTRESERLLREAVAMGKISHPNVVQVYDSGLADGEVFVVMERIGGPSLDTWLRERPRSWHEIVNAFLQAGRGLVAAHAVGLVHRDFKPANVLVGEDGRVRVGDFGLACAEPSAPVPGHIDPGRRSGQLSGQISTQTQMQGTPAYMAPEQLDGEAASPQSDQFSFCVALHEALFGERPARPGTPGPVRSRLPGAEDPSGVPARLRRALARGCAEDAGERWPSMEALVREIEQCMPEHRRGRLFGGLALGAAAIAGALLAVSSMDDSDPCASGGELVAQVWNETRRAGLDARVRSAGATTGWSTSLERLDAFFEGWEADHRDACEATHVHRRQSGALLDKRVGCLDAALVRADVLLEVLEDDAVSGSPDHHQTVASLPRLETCSDPEALDETPEPADEGRRRKLLRAAALYDVGAYETADALASQVREDASAAGEVVLAANAAFELGKAQAERGNFEGGRELLEDAFFEATHARARPLALRSASTLAAVSVFQNRVPEGRTWLRQAEALDGPTAADPENLQGYLTAAAGLAATEGDYARANALRAEEVEHMERAYGKRSLRYLGSRRRQVQTMIRRGRPDEALSISEESLRIATELFPPDHPELAAQHRVAGGLAASRGDVKAARLHLQKALDIYESSGSHPLDLATTAFSLAKVEADEKNYDKALALYDRAHALRSQFMGAGHPETAYVINAKATIYYARGEYEKAAEEYARALDLLVDELGRDHPDVAIISHNLGLLHYELGDLDAALEHHEVALAALEAAGAGPQTLGKALQHTAKVLIDLGRPREALVYAERAVALSESAGQSEEQLAGPRFEKARALSAMGRRREGRALGEQVRGTLEAAGGPDDELKQRLDAWLAG